VHAAAMRVIDRGRATLMDSKVVARSRGFRGPP
jgi:hypothetical protein